MVGVFRELFEAAPAIRTSEERLQHEWFLHADCIELTNDFETATVDPR
jgi:hypothetical protein